LNGGEVDATGAAQTCGLGCLANEDPGACSMTCVVEATGLSQGCSGCFVQTIVCTIDNCVGACAVDPTSEDCGKCQSGDNENEVNCIAEFYACSGLTPPEPPAECDSACEDGQSCVDGACVDDTPPADCDPACEDGQSCVDGDCVDDTPPADSTFCDNFATICGEIMACGDGTESCAFADDAPCQAWWDAADEDPTPEEVTAGGANQGCYSYHLGAAAGDDSADPPVAANPELHCAHAKGEALCVE
jgi:hypothetical protein